MRAILIAMVFERHRWLQTPPTVAARLCFLEDAQKLQQFLKEADHIDSVIGSHAAFLDFDGLGVST